MDPGSEAKISTEDDKEKEKLKGKVGRQGSLSKGVSGSTQNLSTFGITSNDHENEGGESKYSSVFTIARRKRRTSMSGTNEFAGEPETNVTKINGHQFVEYIYSNPVSCRLCKTSIWHYGQDPRKCKQTILGVGHCWQLNKKALKCKDCSADVHPWCAEGYQLPCEPGHFIRNVRKSLMKRGRTRSIDDYAQIVRPSAGYLLEDGLSGILNGSQEVSPPVSLNETPWYSLHFLGKDHDHFVMSDKKQKFNPIILSIIRESPDQQNLGSGLKKDPEQIPEEEGDEVEQPNEAKTSQEKLEKSKHKESEESSSEEDDDDDDDENDEDHHPNKLSNQKAKSHSQEWSQSELSGEEKDKKKKEKKEKKEKKKQAQVEKKQQKEKEKQEKKLQKKQLKQSKSQLLEPANCQYRVIIWKKTGKEQWTIPVKHDELLSGSQIVDIILTQKGALKMMDKHGSLFSSLTKELTMMEREEFSKEFKFGVLYMKKGQNHEDEFFGNQDASPEFYEFLDIFAEKFELKGYQGYKGGLDTEHNSSGEYAYRAEYEGNSLIFHVSPLLPYSATDLQQIKRKRHIGNDIVCIVFQDSVGCCFSPRAIKSQMIHTYIAVCLEGSINGVKRYRVNVTSKDTVPPFGPPLPDPPVFTDTQELKEFLMHKLINAERSALFSDSFQQKKERTLAAHLSYIHSRYSGESTGKKTLLRQKLGETSTPRRPNRLIHIDAKTLSFSPFGTRSARSSFDTSTFRSFFNFDNSSSHQTTNHSSNSNSNFSPLPEKSRRMDSSTVKVRKGSFLNSLTESLDSQSNQNQNQNQSTRIDRQPNNGSKPKLKRRGSAPALFYDQSSEAIDTTSSSTSTEV